MGLAGRGELLASHRAWVCPKYGEGARFLGDLRQGILSTPNDMEPRNGIVGILTIPVEIDHAGGNVTTMHVRTDIGNSRATIP